MPVSHPARAPISTPAAATVFTTVLTRGPVSRVDVARLTGLSAAAVTKASRPLIEAGYLAELSPEGRDAGRPGRPANPLVVCAEREFFVGVKITGDELIGVVTDLQARVRTARHRQLAATGVEEVVAQLTELLAVLLEESGAPRGRVHCLGVAISGDVDRQSGLVRYSPFLGWRNVPLGRLLQDATGLITTVENDVKALTVAEQWFGEGIGATSFALVTVGAGIGCGLVVNGAVVAGAHGVAGEIGHLPVAADPTPCHCGATGCLEAVASTDAVLAGARSVSGRADLVMDEAVALARKGDVAIGQVFARAGAAIGLGIASVANLVGPERIVVSGEGVAAYDLFEEHVRSSFMEQAFGAASRCALVIRPLPFEEWARGASAVAIGTLFIPARG
jgi:predicted NBD/HSP70 family sugar kinase